MDFILLVLGYVVVMALAFVLYIFKDLPVFQHGVIGSARKALHEKYLQLMPKWIQHGFSSLYYKLFVTRTRLYQFLYMAVYLFTCAVIGLEMVPLMYAFHPTENHTFPFLLLFVLNLIFYYFCAKDPGVVTSSNVSLYASIDGYDGVLYKEGQLCKECGIPKVPRSKHCVRCGHCVYKFDHHCVWTNCCVGGFNNRWFLAITSVIFLQCCHAVYLGLFILSSITSSSNLWQAQYVDYNGEPQPMTLLVLIQHLFMEFPRIVFVIAFLGLMFIALCAFLPYHLYLCATNLTTNELHRLKKLQHEEEEQEEEEGGTDTGHQRARTWRNPFSKGVLLNLILTFYPSQAVRLGQEAGGQSDSEEEVIDLNKILPARYRAAGGSGRIRVKKKAQ